MNFENEPGQRTAERTRSFLDSDILLGFYRGDAEVAHLFDEAVLRRTRYAISPVVIQEVLFRLDESKLGRVDLDEIQKLMEIIPYEDALDEASRSDELAFLRNAEWNMHINDYLNIFAARRGRCDFFITRDRDLLDLHQVLSMQIVTPAGFLQAEPVA